MLELFRKHLGKDISSTEYTKRKKGFDIKYGHHKSYCGVIHATYTKNGLMVRHDAKDSSGRWISIDVNYNLISNILVCIAANNADD